MQPSGPITRWNAGVGWIFNRVEPPAEPDEERSRREEEHVPEHHVVNAEYLMVEQALGEVENASACQHRTD